ncbi:hypothetical protein F0562_017937 [Nyssa sinensis]|uniref:Uncharacterized protein n=1 Tax=Nyssa sinensis TaxID=561372 RepID=A0A5J4ZB15_9ASTE|nr:hypothetical protein F0562_017937 [Nyssa sinensis]
MLSTTCCTANRTSISTPIHNMNPIRSSQQQFLLHFNASPPKPLLPFCTSPCRTPTPHCCFKFVTAALAAGFQNQSWLQLLQFPPISPPAALQLATVAPDSTTTAPIAAAARLGIMRYDSVRLGSSIGYFGLDTSQLGSGTGYFRSGYYSVACLLVCKLVNGIGNLQGVRTDQVLRLEEFDKNGAATAAQVHHLAMLSMKEAWRQ